MPTTTLNNSRLEMWIEHKWSELKLDLQSLPFPFRVCVRDFAIVAG